MQPFFQLSGAGNDFLALVEPASLPDPQTIRCWCRRGIGVGTDGLFVLHRPDPVALPQHVRMTYFNGDGGRADLCLNGTRCAARLAFDLGWGLNESLTIETDVGTFAAERRGPSLMAIEMPMPKGSIEVVTLVIEETPHRGFAIDSGVPHFVVLCEDDLGAVPVATLGAALRSHAFFGAAGTNVNFVQYPSRNRLEIRSFERGVEAETLACGTGVIAAFLVGQEQGHLDYPVSALTSSGFELTIEQRADGGVTLVGDARIVARGELTNEAAAAPGEPAWTGRS